MDFTESVARTPQRGNTVAARVQGSAGDQHARVAITNLPVALVGSTGSIHDKRALARGEDLKAGVSCTVARYTVGDVALAFDHMLGCTEQRRS
ncbi:hypothetical protein D3C71_1712210 [compost metagenome]